MGRGTLFSGIEQWVVFGGSWGATLGLLYGQSYPSACVSLVLRGISNSHAFQDKWILCERPKLLPKRHHAFLRDLDSEQQLNPVAAHRDNIVSTDPVRQWQALQAVSALESGLSNALALECDSDSADYRISDSVDKEALRRATIYLHYWVNRKFLGERECVPSPAMLNSIPITFVHGE